MPPSGRSWRFALLGENDRAWDLFTLINPVNHGATPESNRDLQGRTLRRRGRRLCRRAPHRPRRLDWYTGSAGWMYRLLLETLLGVNLAGNHLVLTPRLPKKWGGFTIHYRYRQTHYRIRITRSSGAPPGGNRLSLDGQATRGQ